MFLAIYLYGNTNFSKLHSSVYNSLQMFNNLLMAEYLIVVPLIQFSLHFLNNNVQNNA